MVPCGVPKVTLDQLDLVPLRITRCLRPVRKCLSQACKQPSIPLFFNFSRSRSWGTLSNALARSRKTTSVGRDKLRDLTHSFNDDNGCVTVDLPFRKPNWLLFIRLHGQKSRTSSFVRLTFRLSRNDLIWKDRAVKYDDVYRQINAAVQKYCENEKWRWNIYR